MKAARLGRYYNPVSETTTSFIYIRTYEFHKTGDGDHKMILLDSESRGWELSKRVVVMERLSRVTEIVHEQESSWLKGVLDPF